MANGYIDDVAIIVDYHGVNVRIINNASSSVIYETLKTLREFMLGDVSGINKIYIITDLSSALIL